MCRGSCVVAEHGCSEGSARSIEQAILKAPQASLENSDALVALAQIELHLAQSPSARSRTEFDGLIDKWGQALLGVDADELERLKRGFSERGELP